MSDDRGHTFGALRCYGVVGGRCAPLEWIFLKILRTGDPVNAINWDSCESYELGIR